MVGYRMICDTFSWVSDQIWFPPDIPFRPIISTDAYTSHLSFLLILSIIFLVVSAELPDEFRSITAVKLCWKKYGKIGAIHITLNVSDCSFLQFDNLRPIFESIGYMNRCLCENFIKPWVKLFHLYAFFRSFVLAFQKKFI